MCYPQLFTDYVRVSTHDGGAWLTSSVAQKRSRSTAPVFTLKNFLLTILFRIVSEGVATMVGTIERFEVISRGVLELAVQPSNGASSQPQPSPAQPTCVPTTDVLQPSENIPRTKHHSASSTFYRLLKPHAAHLCSASVASHRIVPRTIY